MIIYECLQTWNLIVFTFWVGIYSSKFLRPFHMTFQDGLEILVYSNPFPAALELISVSVSSWTDFFVVSVVSWPLFHVHHCYMKHTIIILSHENILIFLEYSQ